jgi:hypothetical protein
MPNWNGVRVYSRKNPNDYLVNAHDRWYYYNWGMRLQGPFESREQAIDALRKEWENSSRE